MSVDSALLAAATEAADAAGAAIRPFFRAPSLTADRKGDQSPVTEADRGAERAIRAVLERRFPEHGILGEEFGLVRPGARRRWVVDPIDGTRAFITGRPLFATLIALLEDDQPILGVMDQPVTGERWIGLRGEATRFRGTLGGAAGTRPCPRLDGAELVATSPAMFLPADLARFERLAASVGRVSWGGDAYGYGLLALGQVDVVCECDLKPWDWAALRPIVEGAGGAIETWDGTEWPMDGPAKVLAVGDRELLGAAREVLGGALPRTPPNAGRLDPRT